MPIHHTSRRIGRLAAAGLVLLAACSSDDTTSTTVETVATSSTVTAETTPATDAVADTTVTTDQGEIDLLGSYSFADEEFGTMVTVTVEGGTRTIVTNALPDHETGEFPNAGNPNTITAQDLTWTFPTEPVFTGEATFAMTPGVAVNGVKFEPATAESVTCASGESYRVEALQELYDLGLDFNNAHVQPTGEYHYHGISELLVEAHESGDDLVMVGFAADGHLMYYSKSAAYQPSFQLSTSPRAGSDCVGSSAIGGGTIEVEGTTPDGTYTSDWVFDQSIGDLDSCNGTTINGEYVYLITDTFPFAPRCLNGEVGDIGGAGAGGGAAPGGAAPGGAAPGGAAPGGAAPGTAPDLTEAAATLGVTVEELQAALGGPPPDFAAAAEKLGITLDELMAALPQP